MVRSRTPITAPTSTGKQVIHFTGTPFGDNRDSEISSITLDEFAPDSWVGIIPYEDYPHYSHLEVIERAKNQLGDEHDYDLFNWNCEHFAMWCVTGVDASRQTSHVNRGC